MKQKITIEASPGGLTVDELGSLIARAHRLGATGRETVQVRTTWNGTVKRAEITIEHTADDTAEVTA